jgi:hypothetical protein
MRCNGYAVAALHIVGSHNDARLYSNGKIPSLLSLPGVTVVITNREDMLGLLKPIQFQVSEANGQAKLFRGEFNRVLVQGYPAYRFQFK